MLRDLCILHYPVEKRPHLSIVAYRLIPEENWRQKEHGFSRFQVLNARTTCTGWLKRGVHS